MIFNVLKDPIAVWYRLADDLETPLPQIPTITFGREEFNWKIESENLPRNSVENSNWNKDFVRYGSLILFRDRIVVGKYQLIDGIQSLYNSTKITSNINWSNYAAYGSKNGACFHSERNYNPFNQDLFFTAPRFTKGENEVLIDVRSKILSGKQPLRNTRHYRSMGRVKGNISGDKLEGLSNLSEASKINEGIRSGYINDLNIEKIPFESHIFSLHDSTAEIESINKFGEDTYLIKDVAKWVGDINDQVIKYWSIKRPDFIGTLIIFNKINYTNRKNINHIKDFKKLSKLTPGFPSFNPDANYLVDGLDITSHSGIEVNILEDSLKYHFEKSPHYKGESEHRLCIIPLYSNPLSDGPIIPEYIDSTIWMDIEGYKNSIELLSADNPKNLWNRSTPPR